MKLTHFGSWLGVMGQKYFFEVWLESWVKFGLQEMSAWLIRAVFSGRRFLWIENTMVKFKMASLPVWGVKQEATSFLTSQLCSASTARINQLQEGKRWHFLLGEQNRKWQHYWLHHSYNTTTTRRTIIYKIYWVNAHKWQTIAYMSSMKVLKCSVRCLKQKYCN